ncbi:uncharacterized protein B0I36DRAFT_349613 [Microdochium trichocladiopsis]|uniref:Uncharacterized protein n=1 Tax=Microdochium trichocladiopsis TaxID=1682393 RepID=A0A9P8Y8C5_9PEZI|nr:uncharacterized protein B0I36DRAFT_349613 [Microdochium trichocladiopsis]KAH7031553.1 hypothetical protein B0I36DRAFT_349613 [Microdochium trichocladiopsis]
MHPAYFSLLVGLLTQTSSAATTNNACSGGLYALFMPLKPDPQVKAFCNAKYKPGTKTITATASRTGPTSTGTVTATALSTSTVTSTVTITTTTYSSINPYAIKDKREATTTPVNPKPEATLLPRGRDACVPFQPLPCGDAQLLMLQPGYSLLCRRLRPVLSRQYAPASMGALLLSLRRDGDCDRDGHVDKRRAATKQPVPDRCKLPKHQRR